MACGHNLRLNVDTSAFFVAIRVLQFVLYSKLVLFKLIVLDFTGKLTAFIAFELFMEFNYMLL